MLETGDKIVDCPPTFAMYEFDANVNGAAVVKGRINDNLDTSLHLFSVFMQSGRSSEFLGSNCAKMKVLKISIHFFSAVLRHPDFSLNVEEIARVVELEKPKCIFLTSPNNPDGRLVIN